MRKSKDISKYSLDWQVTRVLAKDLKTVEEKVEHITSFLQLNRSQQNWERVVNYLEGLALGYKKNNTDAVKYINSTISSLGNKDDYAWDIWDHSLCKWEDSQLLKCYKDNMKRFTSYCSKGYFHKELYDFCKSFAFSDLHKIEQLKEEALSKPNTHYFFF